MLCFKIVLSPQHGRLVHCMHLVFSEAVFAEKGLVRDSLQNII